MTQQSTMRDLLARWAATEPGKCHLHEEIEGFTVSSGKWWYLALNSNLAEESNLMKIQWAVQQAIVSRGWSFWIGHDSHYGFGYEAEINADLAQDINAQGHTSAAEVLLTAYLQALENKKAG